MTPAEQHFYEDVRAIRKNMNRIADALEAIARNAPSDGIPLDEFVERTSKILRKIGLQNPETPEDSSGSSDCNN